MGTKAVTDASFEADVLKAEKPVLVDFWAEWCGPCRQIGPDLEALAAQYDGKIDIVKMDVDKNPAVPSKYNVRSIPALLIFKGGEVVSTQVGALPRSRLASWIETTVATDGAAV